MRRKNNVPVKNPLPASHRQGVSKPVSHHSLSAYNNLLARSKPGQKTLSVKKNASCYSNVTRDFFFSLINPLFTFVKHYRNFFYREKLGFNRGIHKTISYAPQPPIFVLQVSLPNHHKLRLLFFPQ